MVVCTLIGGHQLIQVIARHLNMLAYKAASKSALVVAAGMSITLDHFLSIFAPPD